MKIENNSWLWPNLKSIIVQHKQILFNWRKQRPSKSGRIKDFENWLLVELVHQIMGSSKNIELCTNGHFLEDKEEKKVSVVGLEKLLGKKLDGSKSSANNLSADISVRGNKINPITGKKFIYSAEIKTCLSQKEILDDLLIVKYYNKARIADKSEFGWIVLLPEKKEKYDSSLKTYSKIINTIETEYKDFNLIKSQESENDWIRACVAIYVEK